ncbi:MAG: hypothetical protein HQL52_18385 [Magnetococcales bacterium]|nr:hypothetical protein [Magnetococcales bacterium]
MPDPVQSHAALLWIDNLAWPILLLAAIWMALAPFNPEPHLVEKVRMLFQGTLTKPLDIFDLFLHATPQVVVITKAVRQFIMGVGG